jgi:glycerol-3-phosphate acyltransferase PlsX
VLTLDLGANVDCTARHLCDFAEMGVQYVRQIADIEKPRVGLLNIGEESVKGNELAKTVNKYLSATPHLNFVGNVEPKGLFSGVADVVVCDGFAGNLLLKTGEASGLVIKDMLAREFKATPLSMIGAIFGYGAFRRLKRTVDPNRYNGAELLGVNGVVIILHGSCNARGVGNGIQGARVAVEKEINRYIREGIQELRATEELVDSGEADTESTEQ